MTCHFGLAQVARLCVSAACSNGAQAGLACVARRMTLLRAEHTSTKPVQLKPVARTVALNWMRMALPTSRPRWVARAKGIRRIEPPPGAMTAEAGRGGWGGAALAG